MQGARKIKEVVCGMGYCRGHGKRHSWKEHLHAEGGTSQRDSGPRQPTPG